MSRSDNRRVQDGSDACQGSIRGNPSAAASLLSPVGRAGFLNWSFDVVSLIKYYVLPKRILHKRTCIRSSLRRRDRVDLASRIYGVTRVSCSPANT